MNLNLKKLWKEFIPKKIFSTVRVFIIFKSLDWKFIQQTAFDVINEYFPHLHSWPIIDAYVKKHFLFLKTTCTRKQTSSLTCAETNKIDICEVNLWLLAS